MAYICLYLFYNTLYLTLSFALLYYILTLSPYTAHPNIDDRFPALLSALTDTCTALVRHIPTENDVIYAVGELLISLSTTLATSKVAGIYNKLAETPFISTSASSPVSSSLPVLYDVNYLITLPAINSLYMLISGGSSDVSGTGTGTGGSGGGSGGPQITPTLTPIPLSLEGVTVLYQAVCMLVVNAVSRPLCEQVRDALYKMCILYNLCVILHCTGA